MQQNNHSTIEMRLLQSYRELQSEEPTENAVTLGKGMEAMADAQTVAQGEKNHAADAGINGGFGVMRTADTGRENKREESTSWVSVQTIRLCLERDPG